MQYGAVTRAYFSTHNSTIWLRYIDPFFLGRQNHDNQINAKFDKNLVYYIEFGCLSLN